jgi:hypothetical protein
VVDVGLSGRVATCGRHRAQIEVDPGGDRGRLSEEKVASLTRRGGAGLRESRDRAYSATSPDGRERGRVTLKRTIPARNPRDSLSAERRRTSGGHGRDDDEHDEAGQDDDEHSRSKHLDPRRAHGPEDSRTGLARLQAQFLTNASLVRH